MHATSGTVGLFADPRAGQPSITIRWRTIRKGGQPLLYLPERASSAAAAMGLYPAQTLLARSARYILRQSLRFGIGFWFPTATQAIDPLSGLARFITEVTRIGRFPEIAVFAGNPRALGRRFILMPFDAAGQPGCIIKAGQSAKAIELIEREYAFLADAPSSTGAIPTLKGHFRDAGIAAFAMEYIEGASPRIDDMSVPSGVLSKWVHPERLTTLGATPAWRELENTESHHPLIRQLAKLRDHSVARTLWHGDFAPWNIKVNRRSGRTVVIDWERGQLTAPPGWDWFHYEIQTSILVRRLKTPALIRRIDALLASIYFRTYAANARITGLERTLLLAYLLHQEEVHKPTEGAPTIAQLLEALTRRWEQGSE